MPTVSVIIPVYNAEKYLSRCLDSVLSQTMDDFEVLCVDDGSTDASRVILEKYASRDKRVSVLSQANMGVSAARNAGLEHSCGKYVCFLDADDYIHSQMLEMLLKVAEDYNVDIVDSFIEKVYADSKIKSEHYDFSELDVAVFDDPFAYFMKNRKLKSSSNARMYRKSILKGIRFVTGIRYEDVPFSVETMFKAKKLALIKQQFYYYFQHQESFMHQPFVIKNVDDYAKVMRLVYEIGESECPDKLVYLQRNIINTRFKMMVNQAVRRQQNEQVQKQVFAHMQQRVRQLYNDGVLSYSGLRLKHKIRLFLLLHCKSAEPCRYLANLI